jgi:flagellar protein FliO/FliZ
MASPFATLLTAVAALAVVLGLVWLASRAARWGGLAPRPTGGRRLVVQDALALDARRRLTLVRCDGRSVLLLTGGPQDLVVGWMNEPGKPAEPSAETQATGAQAIGAPG